MYDFSFCQACMEQTQLVPLGRGMSGIFRILTSNVFTPRT